MYLINRLLLSTKDSVSLTIKWKYSLCLWLLFISKLTRIIFIILLIRAILRKTISSSLTRYFRFCFFRLLFQWSYLPSLLSCSPALAFSIIWFGVAKLLPFIILTKFFKKFFFIFFVNRWYCSRKILKFFDRILKKEGKIRGFGGNFRGF